MIATVACFFWLFTTSRSYTKTFTISESLQPIEIESVKKEATDMLDGVEKNASIPIALPTTKMGRTNPFDNI